MTEKEWKIVFDLIALGKGHHPWERDRIWTENGWTDENAKYAVLHLHSLKERLVTGGPS